MEKLKEQSPLVRSLRLLAMTWFCVFLSGSLLVASEIFQETNTEIVVREHPKTGKTFVSIAEKGKKPLEFLGRNQKILRPDYRMLDPKAKKGDYVYDGPVSDRKKVYILAASLAATGAASAVAGAALMPAAATTATSSGAGAGVYAAAGAGVAAGTVSTALIKSQPDPHRDDFTHESKTELIDENEDDDKAV